MKEQLIALLESFGFPVKLQGSLGENEAYPDSFFTFWNSDTPEDHHYDNAPTVYEWYFTIYFYSTDPIAVNAQLLEARALLKENGWITLGKGYDVPSDVPTHTGRGMDIIYLEFGGN